MAETIGGSVVSGIASKVAELLFDPIREEISYVFKYKSNMKELKNVSERMEQAVKQADRQGDDIFSDVREWLTKFGGVKPVVEDEGEEEGNKNRCTFKDLCSSMMIRYKLGKEAAKAAKEGDKILRGIVCHRPAPETIERFHVAGYEHFPSRNSVFQNIMEALRDSNVKMVGLYGMGGIGKSTLVKVVAKKVLAEGLFDTVVVAELTHTPDWKAICDHIAGYLGLEIGHLDSVAAKVGRLRQTLKKKKQLLVILDDIWTKLNLNDIGIPFEDEKKQGDNSQRHVIILISRDPKIFSVNNLLDGEAKFLFEKIVGRSAKKV